MKPAVPPRPVTGPFVRAALLLALLVLGVVALWPLRSPQVSEGLVPAASEGRAASHQAALAREPRPPGTQAHRAVQDYLARQISSAGLRPTIQEETVVLDEGSGVVRAGRVHNVLARLPGNDPTGALLLVAHYDSVAHSPGAADNGAGVAALLETMRRLGEGTPPRNDVIFLFTDLEEWRRMGALAFLGHPWAEDVDFVINLEARGNQGPSILFETGLGTGGLVRRYARTAPSPVTTSLSRDVYRVLPNVTDFGILRELGEPGFNFALIGGATAYHTRLDTVDAGDPVSLRHHLGTVLALARELGDEDLDAIGGGGPQTYFLLPGIGLVSYPVVVAAVLGALAPPLAILVIVIGARRGRLSVGRSVQASAYTLVAAAAGAAPAFAVHGLLVGLLGLDPRMLGDGIPYLLAWTVSGFSTTLALLLGLTPWMGRAETIAGSALLWSLLAAVTGFLLQGSSYLFLGTALALCALLVVELRGPSHTPVGTAAATAALAAPIILLWAPILYLLAVALGVGSSVQLALAGGLVATSLLLPFSLITGDAGWRAPLAMTGLAVIAGLGLAVAADYTSSTPRLDSVLYLLDGETGKTVWASPARVSDPWTEQFFGSPGETGTLQGFFRDDLEVLLAPAPSLDLTAPEVEITPGEDPSSGNDLAVRVRSPRRAESVRVFLDSTSPIRSLRLADEEIALPADSDPVRWDIVFLAPEPEGFILELSFSEEAGKIRSGELTVTAVDRKYGLPATPSEPWRPRPPEIIPSPFATTDVSMVRSETTFSRRPAVTDR